VAQSLPRVADLGPDAGGGLIPAGEPRREQGVEDREPAGPGPLSADPLLKFSGERAKHIRRVKVEVREFPGGHTEQAARAHRGKGELDAGLVPIGQRRGRHPAVPGRGDPRH
jgi:hypothetical protein